MWSLLSWLTPNRAMRPGTALLLAAIASLGLACTDELDPAATDPTPTPVASAPSPVPTSATEPPAIATPASSASPSTPAESTATQVVILPTSTSVPPPTSTSVPPPTATLPAVPTTVPIADLCGAPQNPYGYNFCLGGGSSISSPPRDICQYIPCIASFWNGNGYVIQCRDGTFGKSGGLRGSCSGHGGNGRTLRTP